MPLLRGDLQTRLGRRIAGLFVLSALAPVLLLAALGYRQVRIQLLAQSREQQAQAAKSVGMGVLDQLRMAKVAVDYLAVATSTGLPPATAGDSADPIAAMFGSLALVRGGRVTALRGQAPPGDRAVGHPWPVPEAGKTLLAVGHDTSGVWLISPLTRSGGQLWAQLRPQYLFLGARERAAIGRGDVTVCVTDTASGRRLYCEEGGEEGPRLDVSWDLFLGYEYGAGTWRIDVGQPRAAILAPILIFRRTLFGMLVAALGLVVVLTSVQVRRSLEPLRALRDGTRRLAGRDFSEPVRVRSGDEFEDLAGSFNQMAGELDGQFQANAQLIVRLDELSYGALAALARAVDASSPWTAGHSERVTALSLRMAAMLGLPPSDQETLRRGGLLHDIGKIGIAPQILDKPGPLDPAELARIREHPALGARILEPLAAFAEAIPIVRSHHERLDGGGYPDGLRGERIPFLARLLAVADVYDALVSDRPYRPGWSHASALQTIRADSGSHFDPVMVEVFLRVIAAEGDAARAPTVATAPA